MNGKTHQIVGLTGGLLVSGILYKIGVFSLPACLSTIALSSVGSYIPDIDHTGSKAGKKAPLLSYPIKYTSKLFSWLYRKTKIKGFNKISMMFEHRGIFHSPLFWLLIFIPLFIFIPPIVNQPIVKEMVVGGLFGFLLGVMLHLFADMLNPTGIPLFLLIIYRKFRLAKIVTGSTSEMVFKAIAIFVLFISFVLTCLIFFNII